MKARTDIWCRRVLALGVLSIVVLEGLGSTAAAVPPGRSWSPREIYQIPPGINTVPYRFILDADNRIQLLATTFGSYKATELLRWEDSTWIATESLSYQPSIPWPVLSTTGDRYVIWQTFPPAGTLDPADVVIAGIRDGRFFEFDTVTTGQPGVVSYSAAVTARRRWVAVHRSNAFHVFVGGAGQEWRHLATEGDAPYRISVAPLTDSTALIVWSGSSQMYYGLADGDTWSSAPFPHFDYLLNPRLRPTNAGRWLLTTASLGPDVRYSYFSNGEWSELQSVDCAYTDGADSVHSVKSLDISYDDRPFPAAVWTADSYRSGLTSLCVSVPVGDGPAVAETIETEGTVGWLPSITRDRYGDVWLALAYDGPFGFEGMYWNHTYTSATATAPVVTRIWRAMRVQWRLSGPAPGSHWTVLRAHGRSDFEAAGSVSTVGEEQVLSWADEDPPHGQVRYQIRRDCEDVRYQWLSEVGRWPHRARGPRLLILPSEEALTKVQVVDAAPGSVRLQVFDIQGRMVREATAEADTLPVTLTVVHAGLNAGVYFVRATDQLGDESEALKVVVLK